jgi:hypothetical protein
MASVVIMSAVCYRVVSFFFNINRQGNTNAAASICAWLLNTNIGSEYLFLPYKNCAKV